MKSQTLGKSTSDVEILSIEINGVWLHANGKEYFLPHRDFPWFKEARVVDVLNVKLLHQFHLYWRVDDYNLKDGGKLKLDDGSIISGNFLKAGGTGRLKFNLVDWNQDAKLDLIV